MNTYKLYYQSNCVISHNRSTKQITNINLMGKSILNTFYGIVLLLFAVTD